MKQSKSIRRCLSTLEVGRIGGYMKKTFFGIVLIAVVAISLFAFVACNDAVAYAEAEPDGAWYAITDWMDSDDAVALLGGKSTAALNFYSETRWSIIVGGAVATFPGNNNLNWCQGEYYFDGEVGTSTLHIKLYDKEAYVASEPEDDPDPSIYDPANVTLLDADGNDAGKNNWVALEPDEDGVYIIKARGAGLFGELIGAADINLVTMTFRFKPPTGAEDLGSGGVIVAPPDPGGIGLGGIIGIAVAVIVVVIAAIVVTVVVVKKKKKAKAQAEQQAAAEAESADEPVNTWPIEDEHREDGGEE